MMPMLPAIDIPRCIRHCFEDSESMTPKQRALATDLIEDGPPNNQQRQVVLKMVEGGEWDDQAKTITRDGVSVRLRIPEHTLQWVGTAPSPRDA